MLKQRFSFSMILILAFGMASVEIPVSGTETQFSLENESPMRLNVSLQSGDLFLDNIDLVRQYH